MHNSRAMLCPLFSFRPFSSFTAETGATSYRDPTSSSRVPDHQSNWVYACLEADASGGRGASQLSAVSWPSLEEPPIRVRERGGGQGDTVLKQGDIAPGKRGILGRVLNGYMQVTCTLDVLSYCIISTNQRNQSYQQPHFSYCPLNTVLHT
jgi:hypothetical protein